MLENNLISVMGLNHVQLLEESILICFLSKDLWFELAKLDTHRQLCTDFFPHEHDSKYNMENTF